MEARGQLVYFLPTSESKANRGEILLTSLLFLKAKWPLSSGIFPISLPLDGNKYLYN
jgi:hypothetical protein